MKKLFKTFAVAALAAIPAFAQAAPSFENAEITPEQGTVTSLNDIMVKFPGGFDVDINNYDMTMTCNGSPLKFDITDEGDENILYITLAAEQTGAGTYVLNFPAGSLCLYDAAYDSADNPDLSYTWKIEGGEPSGTFEYKVTWPTGDITEIQAVDIEFPNVYELEINDDSLITATYGARTLSSYASIRSNVLTIELDETATEAGEYVFTIATGALAAYSNDPDDSYLGDNTDPIRVVLTIEGASFVPDFSGAIAEPAQGEVKSLENVMITFPNINELDINSRDDIVMTLNGTKIDVGTGYAYGAKPSATNMNALTFTLPRAYTEQGEYVLTIPAGALCAYDADYNSADNTEAFTFTWNIASASGLDFTFEADPQNGSTVAELAEVTLTFPGLDAILVEEANVEVKIDGATLEAANYTVADKDTKAIVVSFNPAVVINGLVPNKVEITFPAETLLGSKGEEVHFNDTPVILTYNIVAAAAYDIDVILSRPTDPNANGEISANKSIESFFFSADIQGLGVPAGTEHNVTIKEVNGDFEASARLKKAGGLNPDFSYFSAAFGKEPTYNGEYVITIARGALGDQTWLENPEFGRSNDEVVLRFTLVDGVERNRYTIDYLSIDPEAGAFATGDEISKVTVTFPEGVAPVTNASATLAGVDTDYASTAVFSKVSDGVYEVTFTPAPTENGTYVFAVAAGAFGDEAFVANTATGNGSKAIDLTYKIDSTLGINGIALDAADTVIYNLQGARIDAKFSQLPEGIYIVNGKKIIKK